MITKIVVAIEFSHEFAIVFVCRSSCALTSVGITVMEIRYEMIFGHEIPAFVGETNLAVELSYKFAIFLFAEVPVLRYWFCITVI